MFDLVDYSHSFWSLLPPLVAIILTILTKRIYLSLGLGIVSGILLLNSAHPMDSLLFLLFKIKELFYINDHWHGHNIFILAFLLLLGVLTKILSLSGAQAAFTAMVGRRIDTSKGAQLLTVSMGFIIFIDDYFNTLAVGSICRPITDRLRVSRAKLAYLIDSTAAPVCVLAPLSSWGASIIATMGGLIVTKNLPEKNGLFLFLKTLPFNFYAVFAIVMVLVTVLTPFHFKKMGEHQARMDLPENSSLDYQGELSGFHLVIPIVMMIFTTFLFIFLLGYQNLEVVDPFPGWIALVEHSDVTCALFFGALAGIGVALPQIIKNPQRKEIFQEVWTSGPRSMIGPVAILLFAWTLGEVIGEMQTGPFLASFVTADFHPFLLPMILFVVAGVMAFSTGSSWATFGIILPLAAELANLLDPQVIPLAFGATLGGAVFGDHCSPISDTTILSATGAQCPHMDHVLTQLPYSFTAFAMAISAYALYGYSRSLWAAYLIPIVLMLLWVSFFIVKVRKRDREA